MAFVALVTRVFSSHFVLGGRVTAHTSTPMRERFSHGSRTDWQMAKACTRGGKDRVSDGGRDRGRRGFSQANWRFRAWQKLDLDFGYAAHAQ